MCKKARYATRWRALDALVAMGRQKGRRLAMHPYRCASCGAWHLGHQSKHAKTVELLRDQAKWGPYARDDSTR